jgi:amino acid adenylation domain-containing protein
VTTHQADRSARTAQTVHRLFEQQVDRTPEAVAVISEQDARMSFRELDQRANRLARHLRRLGVGPDVLCGLCLSHSSALIEAMLAIFKAGGAYVPLDPAFLQHRASDVLADARPLLLITTSDLLDDIPQSDALTVCLDIERGDIFRQDSARLASVDPGALVHVIYTSGSTGKPKGVVAAHRSEVNRLKWMSRRYPHARDEVGCLKTSLDFIDSFSEIFWPLTAGRPVVPVDRAQATDPRALLNVLERHRITRLVAVPSLLRAFVEACPDLGQKLPQLRYCMSCGEPLSVALARELIARLPGCRLINLYGSTEVTADATFYEVDGRSLSVTANGNVPIGRPIDNMSLQLLDEQGQPVKDGECGEIVIGGPGVCRGYLGKPSLSRERFVPDGRDETATHYHTGDLGRRLPDGNTAFVGRADQQIKIRGYRIEPGEIEAALSEHPSVSAAVVVARNDRLQGNQLAGSARLQGNQLAGSARLFAFVVLCKGDASTPGTSATEAELRRFIAQKLPDYMWPATIVALETLPLNESGKVDRAALPIAANRAPSTRSLTAPRNAVERTVLEVWRSVLERDDISIEDNFFDIGGDSLSALKMLLRLEERTKSRIDAGFFENPTLAKLATLIRTPPKRRATRPTIDGPRSWQELVRLALEPPVAERAINWTRRLPESLMLRLPYFHGIGLLRRFCQSPLATHVLYRDESRLVRRFFAAVAGREPSAATLREALVADVLHRRMEKATSRTMRRDELITTIEEKGIRFWRPFGRITAQDRDRDHGELFERHYRLDGRELLERARERGRGVILLTHHTPLFRMAMPAVFRLGFERTMIAGFGKQQKRKNGELAASYSALTFELHSTLSDGGLVLFAGEGRKGRVRSRVPICGRVYPIRAGFAELAIRTGATVLPLTATLADDGKIELTVHAEIPRGDSTLRRSKRARQMVLRYAEFLDNVWKNAPESLTLRRMQQHLQLPEAGQ